MTKTQTVGAVLLVAIAAVLLYVYRAPVAEALAPLKILPQPEAFTELYLENVPTLLAGLPKEITPGTKVSFSFTIHNREGHTVSYPYEVYVISGVDTTTTIDQGTVSLISNASTTLKEAYTFRVAHEQATIVVSLPQQGQSLHFFVPNKQ